MQRYMISHDKANHWLYGTIAAYVGAALAPVVGMSPGATAQISAVVVGFTKEVYDHFWGTGFNFVDFAMTAGAATPLVFLLD